MTIQRQYSLPNCTLILEGLGEASAANPADTRPVMSMLVNAECHLPGQDAPLSGGREFFESFVKVVSQYAQELLSGIHVAQTVASGEQLLQFQRLNANYHRLSLRPASAPPDTGIATHLTREIDLTTVQVFDLVEAVDQFFADGRTLPDLALTLQPLSKRYIRSGEPIAKRAVPAAMGLSSVALAAIAFFFIPVPKVQQPENLVAPSGSNTATTSGTPSATPSSAAAGSSPKPTPSGSPNLSQLETTLTAAPAITDSAELDTLRQQLYTQVDQAWKTRSGVTQDLVYRVGVAKDGAILGYKPVNPAALENAKQTPLLDLIYRSPNGSRSPSEPLAQFKVVFTSGGLLEVAPWQDSMATPLSGTPEITDAEQVDQLLTKLYGELDQNWKQTPTFEKELIFRVRMKPDGTIADYRPENQPAYDYVQETPLSNLGKPADENEGSAQESYALFRVVFQPDGKLEVSPWRGRNDPK